MKAEKFLAIFVFLAFGLLAANATFAQNKNKQQQQQSPEASQKAKKPAPPPRQVSPPPQPARSQMFQQPGRQASPPAKGYQAQPSPPPRQVSPPPQPVRSQTFQQPGRQAGPPARGYQPQPGYQPKPQPKSSAQQYPASQIVQPRGYIPPSKQVAPAVKPQAPAATPTRAVKAGSPTPTAITSPAQPQPKSSPQQYPAPQSAQPKGYIPPSQQTPARSSGSAGQSSPSVKPSLVGPSPPAATAPKAPQAPASVSAGQSYQLVKSPDNPTVYILKDGKKYAIQGADDFKALGLDWNKIQTMPSAQLNSMGKGDVINKSNVANYSQQLLGQPMPGYQVSPSSSSVKPAPVSSSPPVATAPQAPASVSAGQSYQLVKSHDNPTVYILKDGKKYSIQGANDFNALGLDWNKIQTMPTAQLNSIDAGGFINKSNAATYSQQLLGRPMPGYQTSPTEPGTPPGGHVVGSHPAEPIKQAPGTTSVSSAQKANFPPSPPEIKPAKLPIIPYMAPDKGEQCTHYLTRLTNIDFNPKTKIPNYANAKEWYKNAVSQKDNGFKTSNIPEPGSIFVLGQWNKTDGANGHVGYINVAQKMPDGKYKLEILHANWPGSNYNTTAIYDPVKNNFQIQRANGKFTDPLPVEGFVTNWPNNPDWRKK